MRDIETLIIGGGIAGLSLAARVAHRTDTLVLEAESAPGYHASGRSVAIAHFGLGERIVRTLTALSLSELAAVPEDDRARSAIVHPALHIGRSDQAEELEALEEVHRTFGCDYARISGEEARALFPALRIGPEHCHEAIVDHGALKLDADAMLQGHVRDLRAAGGDIVVNARVTAIARDEGRWVVETNAGPARAATIVNAAGAWADEIASMAGTRGIGIEPRRRTVISFDTPDEMNVSQWPFTKTVGAGFYILPEGSGRLLASPMDEVKSTPCDAAPEEIDIATIAERVQEATTLPVERIAHSWAGLRSFAPDELPVIGFAQDVPGFFWFAGQGGYGFQTSPALAEIGAALLFDGVWDERLTAAEIQPGLFRPERCQR
ncbi:NAD(P)/FAD-dependent oxidoreductase [Erythrobacter rubeus]|uniref:FAD-binding oxidoreductase n=1 Tax=Erythrobacter rubeus TaxID=2760803 RepID=A0ABR8KV23_9SPHN|nr:FAD-dependent oxidoreductase [Erythrobacter rubeus]MBD2842081.1 FAD-binding oxidoreductase [Erythrobacter rubeus]